MTRDGKTLHVAPPKLLPPFSPHLVNVCESRGPPAGVDDRLMVAEGEAAALHREEVEDGGVGWMGLPPPVRLQAWGVDVVDPTGLTACRWGHQCHSD